MLTSVAWLNRHLEPPTVSPDEAEHVLTHVGFPIESREVLAGGDVRLDVELTSNRGDCLSHVGLAREVAAVTGRRLVLPAHHPMSSAGVSVSGAASLENRLSASGGCPRFLARVITGVKVGPSPEWLVTALESVGQRSINNVVDVSNFVLFELGHPSHAFDLSTLRGRKVIVRHALNGEAFVALDGRRHTLRDDEMVVADAERAVSLAGVIGGLETGVTKSTTDVLLEVATWDPVAVRRAARRLEIRTDASHRFERYVDARDLDWAMERAAALVVQVAGGTLLEGVLEAGGAQQPKRVVFLRSDRCHHLLGIRVPTAEIIRLLHAIGIEVSVERHINEERLRCVIPHHRRDLEREVDLIEEVARLNGLEKIAVAPALEAPLGMRHPAEWARDEAAMGVLATSLTGAGFYEAVTFSFATAERAAAFLPAGLRALSVDEERRKETPFLRPSVVPSLLECRRVNQDAKVRAPGGVRLFECASVFAEQDDGERFGRQTVEKRVVALLADAADGAAGLQEGVRVMRGALDVLAASLGGPGVELEVEASGAPAPGLTGESSAAVKLRGRAIGYISTVSGPLLKSCELEGPVVVAEVELRPLLDLYPPRGGVSMLPRFPAIERDLSVVVDESVTWSRVEQAVRGARPALLEGVEFVGSFRGKQVGEGKKSLTLRMTFRDPERTLRHEEVDPQVSSVVAKLGEMVGGVLRA
ncbi:MAG: phenylalanine--tRNA ligase subunit beta [Planctomycetota bacterium]|nr:phenylalanine--tRNA ligase subunit beta [Planctomycetota bacterium]